MSQLVSTWTVPARGVGTPDYSSEIAQGQVRPGLSLKFGQTLKIFGIALTTLWSPYPYIKPPLAPGATVHILDWETGQIPSTVPAGYLYTGIEQRYSFSQDYQVQYYLDGFLIALVGTLVAGHSNNIAEIVPLSSAVFDPMALSPHDYDITITNLGGAAMEGSFSIFAAMEELGTEPIRGANKIVKCKFCDYEWEVPQETTKINCPKCGQLNIYITLVNFRGF